MPPYIPIPQTPSAKTQFDSQLNERPSGSDRTASASPRLRPPSPSHSPSPFDPATDAEEIAKYRRKTASPAAASFLFPAQPSDAFQRLSIGSVSDAGYGPSAFPPAYPADHPASQPPSRVPAVVLRVWARNRAVFFVFFAQAFGALMNLFARLLELDDDAGQAFHPVQLLFVRMIMTTCASCLYMWYYKVPDFPLGPPGVRWLLVLRGLTGFFGIFGMWYSMMYLPLAEATVFTFLSPSVTGYICHVLLKDPFTRTEQIASAVAFSGIVLITRPLSFISPAAVPVDAEDTLEAALNGTVVPPLASGTVAAAVAATIRDLANATVATVAEGGGDATDSATTLQRLVAILVALLGVLGGSCAFTTIRAIGTRAHPLISVNYFSTWCTIVTATVLTFAPLLGIGQPYLHFALPHTFRQWVYLVLICICGFCMQFLATMGLGLERSNRATAMLYSQMLFAAAFDRFVFGHKMGATSLVGCGMVIGSALWAALSKKPPSPSPSPAPAPTPARTAAGPTTDIEIGVVGTDHHVLSERDVAREPREERAPMLAAADSDEDDVDMLDRAI